MGFEKRVSKKKTELLEYLRKDLTDPYLTDIQVTS